MGSSFDIAGHN